MQLSLLVESFCSSGHRRYFATWQMSLLTMQSKSDEAFWTKAFYTLPSDMLRTTSFEAPYQRTFFPCFNHPHRMNTHLHSVSFYSFLAIIQWRLHIRMLSSGVYSMLDSWQPFVHTTRLLIMPYDDDGCDDAYDDDDAMYAIGTTTTLLQAWQCEYDSVFLYGVPYE